MPSTARAGGRKEVPPVDHSTRAVWCRGRGRRVSDVSSDSAARPDGHLPAALLRFNSVVPGCWIIDVRVSQVSGANSHVVLDGAIGAVFLFQVRRSHFL